MMGINMGTDAANEPKYCQCSQPEFIRIPEDQFVLAITDNHDPVPYKYTEICSKCSLPRPPVETTNNDQSGSDPDQ